jgi:broad specificity phosphatase PhoE
MKTTLLLLRHGATAANLCRPYRLQGLRPDSDLAAVGLDQARAAADALRHFSIDKAYCSPLRRAVATARCVAGSLGLPLGIETGLAEADFGLWADVTWEEIERGWPDAYRAFHADPERHGYPGGENLGEVRSRVLPVVMRLVERHPGRTLLVVGHGTVNRVLLAHWLRLPLSDARKLRQDNAGFCIVEFRSGMPSVRSVNEVGHLPAVAAGT